METAGWILILAAGLIIRGVYKGRVLEIGTDLSDAFTAIVTGDTDKLGEVLTRTGDDNTSGSTNSYTAIGDVATQIGAEAAAMASSPTGSTLAAAAEKRGKAAKGYRWAATGPDYYDCSGLIWRACQDKGYHGPRFVTSDIPNLPSIFEPIAGPAIDAVICWPAHHMGVVTATNQFYSARSVKSGIGFSAIQGFEPGWGKPRYFRFVTGLAKPSL